VIRNEEVGRDRSESRDYRLEQIARRLSEADRIGDLSDVMALIAAELRADEVACQVLDDKRSFLETVASHGWQMPGERYALNELPSSRHVLDTGEALQVLMSDPDTDVAELERMAASGVRSLMKIPIIARKAPIGMLEAWSHVERPWTRSEIHRARVICHLLGAVLDTFTRLSRKDQQLDRVPVQHLSSTGLEAIRRRVTASPAPPQGGIRR
jgi:hypothetical protein